MGRKPLLILTGPTAVGKTQLSIRLACAVNGEIVSADSMQVYRYMDIGSAKAGHEQMRQVPHHLVDVLDPSEEFHVVRWLGMAKEACADIWERGRVPVVTGGTAFYIQALLYDIDFTENDADTELRSAMEKEAALDGGASLYERLKEVDPDSSAAIHPHNVKRVIRALEFYEKTGTAISAHNAEQRQKKSPYAFLYAVLTRDRNELYQRIDRRVDQMLSDGLVGEVSRLKEMGCTRDMVSMQGLGYKEILSYLDGEISLDEAARLIRRDTRHYAKRQMTWFRHEKDAVFFSMDGKTEDEVLDEILAAWQMAAP